MKKRIPAALLSLTLCAGLAMPAAALETEDARALLSEHYIYDLPAAALEAETLDELFSALNDPYTLYYNAEEYASFLTDVNGETLVGIGVQLFTTFDDGFELITILPNSSAQQAGLKAGDKIIAVDGVTLTPQDNISALLTGVEGSEVTVTVRRENGSLADFTMTRCPIEVPLVDYEARGSMGYLDCASFGDSTADEVSFPLWSMDKHTAVWVMDLRSNPGGVTDAAAATATHFAGSGIMVYFRDGQGDLYATRTSPLNQDMTDKPLIILTSGHTASAAEMFSGAIRDYGAGIAVGQRTFGKGVAQIVVDDTVMPDLFQGDAVKITAYQFFSPDGLTCHLMGVLPTLMVEAEAAEAVSALLSSPVPDTAHDWVKLELAGHHFYLDPKACHKAPDTLARLLEALPPSAQLWLGRGAVSWNPITPEELAQKRGLDFHKRTFSDLEGIEQRAAVETLAAYGLLAGDGNGNFLPNRTLTRAELAAMLTAAFQLPAVDVSPFSDVSPDAWHAPAVSAMAARGFLSGTGAGRFEPDRPLTNQELYTVLSAVAEWASMPAHETAPNDVSALQWLEYYAYPEWTHEYIRNLDELGVTVDKENPDAPVTRAQCAQTLFELMDAIGMFWY